MNIFNDTLLENQKILLSKVHLKISSKTWHQIHCNDLFVATTWLVWVQPLGRNGHCSDVTAASIHTKGYHAENESVLVYIKARCRIGDNHLSKPMLT